MHVNYCYIYIYIYTELAIGGGSRVKLYRLATGGRDGEQSRTEQSSIVQDSDADQDRTVAGKQETNIKRRPGPTFLSYTTYIRSRALRSQTDKVQT